jgi:dTDP-4-dehydrorhamnose 3,5-epimerase
MLFSETAIPGVWILEQERHTDERGYFSRTWCADELARRGLVNVVAQSSISYNAQKGTLRGMHYQTAPHQEHKLVSVPRGAIFDVAVDLRPESRTFRKWVGVELSHDNGRMLYVPAGCAHGFQTLTDETLVDYKISVPFASDSSRGVRWNDPAFGIEWPQAERILSGRDATYPDFAP